MRFFVLQPFISVDLLHLTTAKRAEERTHVALRRIKNTQSGEKALLATSLGLLYALLLLWGMPHRLGGDNCGDGFTADSWRDWFDINCGVQKKRCHLVLRAKTAKKLGDDFLGVPCYGRG